MMKSVQDKSVVIPLRMPVELVDKLDKATRLLGYRSRNQLMRATLESSLDEMIGARIIEVKEMSVGEAARRIDGYLSKNPGVHYVSELSEKLGIELSVAFSAAKKLREEGAIRVREQ